MQSATLDRATHGLLRLSHGDRDRSPVISGATHEARSEPVCCDCDSGGSHTPPVMCLCFALLKARARFISKGGSLHGRRSHFGSTNTVFDSFLLSNYYRFKGIFNKWFNWNIHTRFFKSNNWKRYGEGAPTLHRLPCRPPNFLAHVLSIHHNDPHADTHMYILEWPIESILHAVLHWIFTWKLFSYQCRNSNLYSFWRLCHNLSIFFLIFQLRLTWLY